MTPKVIIAKTPMDDDKTRSKVRVAEIETKNDFEITASSQEYPHRRETRRLIFKVRGDTLFHTKT